ncbi:RHS repeat-associated core domain-containing protein [Pseudomonas sp. PCH199]|uniref:RHS repeat-associated core domain-containing protein n=1 Tax=unclassified Pseudomonas TaxID=196821 RepID=UPI000BDB0AB2|nr:MULTISPECIES: RHS repeat-associated core domain-containing protein [unclassified Pseudomonas]MCW8275483.1 RHS repeat-associated core domain-containing protein [Pseudomonas sp. PCH199]PAM84357.1 hypothetical protein CES87_07235 [Pseudomonas sp. ERMR1:02]
MLEAFIDVSSNKGPAMSTSKPANHSSRILLLASDSKNTVLAEMAGSIHRIAYSPYGQQSSRQEVMTRLGFNGELREARLDWYFLGKGYRVYNPRVMRFHSPDGMSPFGEGGLNGYAYCGCEPVMNVDPTGRSFWSKLLKVWNFFDLSNSSSGPQLNALPPQPSSGKGGILGAMGAAMGNSRRTDPKAINKKPLGQSRKQTSAFPIQQSSNNAVKKSVQWASDVKNPATSTNVTISTAAQSRPLSRSPSSNSVSSHSSSGSTPSTVSTVSNLSTYSQDSGYASSSGGSIRSNASADQRIQARLNALRQN